MESIRASAARKEIRADQDQSQQLHVNDRELSELAKSSTDKENSTSAAAEEEGEYSVFSHAEKRSIVFLAGLAALFSPLSANIYYSATNTLAADLNVSLTQINFTVTCYLIFQGLAPTFVGSLSDTLGRRPLYLFCFIIYIASNIGLALQNNYAALFVLRCLQSCGSSGTVALANAVVSDIVTSAKRGSYVSYVLMGAMVGPSFGPVIGGLLDYYIEWQAIFWFLAIFAGVTFVVLLVWLPETCRVVVGNGSIPVPKWNMSLMSYYKLRRQSKDSRPDDRPRPKRKSRPSLIQSVYILFDKESGILLFYSAVFFGGYYMVIAGMPAMLATKYHYTSLKIGLCYIPAGLGSFAAAITMGRLLDWSFKRHAKRLGLEISNSRQQDLSNFPIEAARLQVIFPVAFLAGATVIAYGWLLQYRIQIAGPLIFLCFATFFITCSFQGLSTLVVDLNRDRPSSASAAMNLARCWLGAGASAAVVPLLNVIGVGWTCVLAAGIWAIISPVVLLIIKRGPRWREEKRRKEEEKRNAERTVV